MWRSCERRISEYRFTWVDVVIDSILHIHIVNLAIPDEINFMFIEGFVEQSDGFFYGTYWLPAGSI